MSNVKGKRVAVLVEKFYEDLELWYPVLRLREAGCDVQIVGPKAGETYASKHGYPAKSDVAASEVKAVGLRRRHHPRRLFARPHAPASRRWSTWSPRPAELGKVLAAICHGPWMLCSAKCLKGRKVTGFFAIRDDVENAGGIWQDAACVRDGNLVTSRTPDDLPAFMQGIFAALEEAHEFVPARTQRVWAARSCDGMGCYPHKTQASVAESAIARDAERPVRV